MDLPTSSPSSGAAPAVRSDSFVLHDGHRGHPFLHCNSDMSHIQEHLQARLTSRETRAPRGLRAASLKVIPAAAG